MYYKEFYNDLAKIYGSSSNPVISADSWSNILTPTTASGFQNIDMRIDGGAPVAFGAALPKCLFFGYWSVLITLSNFAVAGDVSINAYTPRVGGINVGGYNGPIVAYKNFPVSSGPSASELWQYQDTAFSNAWAMFPTGALNVYTVSVRFDGVRLTWGS